VIETKDTDKILEILENLSDEALSVNLLKEFSEKNKKFGKLILNQDSALSHDEWKQRCDEAKKEMDEFLAKIESYSL
jgi:hypothetical protein